MKQRIGILALMLCACSAFAAPPQRSVSDKDVGIDEQTIVVPQLAYEAVVTEPIAFERKEISAAAVLDCQSYVPCGTLQEFPPGNTRLVKQDFDVFLHQIKQADRHTRRLC